MFSLPINTTFFVDGIWYAQQKTDVIIRGDLVVGEDFMIRAVEEDLTENEIKILKVRKLIPTIGVNQAN